MRFALEDWSEVKPVAFYMAPNSAFGRALGKILGSVIFSLVRRGTGITSLSWNRQCT